MTSAVEVPQHLTALKRANAIRLKRAALKRHVAEPSDCGESRERAARIVLDCPSEVVQMAVFDLLCATRRGGRSYALRVLRAARLSEAATIGALVPRQRQMLAAALQARSGSGGVHTAMAAAVVERLWSAGLREAGMPGWWRTERDELGGRSPQDALSQAQDAVLALAERDAVLIRRDLERGGR